MKLAQKGLLVISIPLLFQIAFVSLLLFLFSQQKSDLEEESRAREGVSTAHTLMNGMIDANLAAVAFTMTGEPKFERVFDRQMQILQRLTERLAELSAGHPAREEQVRNLSKSIETLDSHYKEYFHNSALVTSTLLGEHPEDANPQANSLAGRSTDVGKSLKFYGDDVEKLADQKLQQIRSTRRVIQFALIGGLFLDVAITASMAWILTKDILGRLNRVYDNIDRLRRKQPLLAPLAKTDEIGEVDEALHRTASSLLEAERAKAEAMSVIHKQLQSPLGDTRSLLNTLYENCKHISERVEKRLEMALSNVDRLLELILELVNSGTSGGKLTLHRSSVSVHSLLRQSVSYCQSMAKQSAVKLVIEHDEERSDTSISGDFDLLCQILVNLITNAIKYSDPHSEVIIGARLLDNQIEIKVTDTGRGIPQNVQENIFQLFQQVEVTDGTKKGGTGLGLAICRAIATEHAGSLTVASTFGEGSTFVLRLPITETAAELPAKPRPKFSVSIWSRMLGLVIRPLGITTALVACLSFAVHTLDTQIEAQINAQLIAGEVNKILMTGVNHLRLTVMRKSAPSKSALKFDLMEKAHLQQLQTLCAGRQELLELTDKLKASMISIRNLTQASVNPDSRHSALSQGKMIDSDNLQKFRDCVGSARLNGRKIIAIASRSEQKNQTTVVAMYSWIMLTTPLAVLAAALLSILSSVHFSQHISGRLETLRRNAEQLAQGPLKSPADKGQDEISQLDQFFHEASDRMEELDQFRKHLVAIVSHEMKTPLQNAFGVVALLPKLIGREHYSEAISINVSLAEYHLRRVIRLVHDLLTVEKIHSGTFNLNIQPTTLESICLDALQLVCDPRDESDKIYLRTCSEGALKIDCERVASVIATCLNNIAATGSSAILSAQLNDKTAEFMIDSQLKLSEINDKFFEQFPDLTSGHFSDITRTIINAHRGELVIESKTDGFATVKLRLQSA